MALEQPQIPFGPSAASRPSGHGLRRNAPWRDASGESGGGASGDAGAQGGATRALWTALRQTPEATLIATSHGQIVCANSALEALVGCQEGVLVDSDLHALFDPATNATMAGVLRKSAADRSLERDAELRNGNTTVHGRVRLSPVMDASRNPTHLIVAFTPASAERDKGLQTDEALAIIGRVAGQVAHDINNELAVLLNYCSVIQRRFGEGSGLATHVKELCEAAWRASRLSQGLLRIGRRQDVEFGGLRLERAVRHIAELVEASLMGQRGLELDLPERTAPRHFPLPRVEQLLLRSAVLSRELPATFGPLRIGVSELPREAGGDALLWIEPVPAHSADTSDPRTPEGVVTEKVREALELAGVRVEEHPITGDCYRLELRFPRDH